MTSVRQTVDSLIAGVAVELKSVERRVDPRSGFRTAWQVHPLGGSNGAHRYHLQMARWPESWQPSSLLVRTGPGRPWLRAELVSASARGEDRLDVVLDLAEALPDGSGTLEVRPDDAAQLRMLTARLHALADSSDEQVRLARAVLGVGAPTTTTVEKRVASQVLAAGSTEWNDEQRQAVGQALGSDLTFVWGPPGTGKTEVLAAVIDGCYRQGQRILFVAPTHTAVDQALLRVCERLSAEPGFEHGLVQRVKGARWPALSERFGSVVDPLAVESRLLTALAGQAQRLQAQQDGLSALLRELAEVHGVEQQMIDLSARCHDASRALADAVQQLARQEGVLDDLDRQLSAARSGTGMTGAWRRRSLPQLAEQQAVAAATRTRAAADVALHRHRRDDLQARLTDVAAEQARLLARFEGRPLPDQGEVRNALELLGAELDRIQSERSNVRTVVRDTTRITATTVAGAVTSRPPERGYDTVVVDEAAMVDLARLFCLTAMAGRRVVIAGDFRQLPPIITTEKEKLTGAEQKVFLTWYARDVFAASGMTSATGRPRGDARLVRLQTQYRMRPPICDLVNAVAYPDAPLRTDRGDDSHLPPSPLLDAPLILVDTSGKSVAGSPNSNPVNAAVVRELVRILQHDDVLPAYRDETANPAAILGVITPYRNQVAALNQQMTERFGRDVDKLVNTVHSFQGSQRPVVVLDTVASGTALGRFYQGVGLDSDTCRLLNVALSRAEDHLVVVADVDAFHRLAPAGGEVRTMIDHLQRHAQVLSVEELVPVRSAAELPDLDEEIRDRPAFFPADEVPAAVEWDIARARKLLHLYCAFVSEAGIRRWWHPLRDAVGRGVRVVIFTRPQSGRQAELCEQLRSNGVEVQHRDAMHEKVLIVDEVMWLGSLNLLAHTRSTDLMIRMTNAAAVEQVHKILRKARPGPPPNDNGSRPAADAAHTPGGMVAPSGDRLYLTVPFEQNSEVKKLGARFDRVRRAWWVDENQVSRAQVARWLPTD